MIFASGIYAYLHTVANQQLANKRAPGAAITRTYIAHRILPLPIKDPRRQSKIGFRVWDPNISNAPPKNTLRLATEPALILSYADSQPLSVPHRGSRLAYSKIGARPRAQQVTQPLGT